MSIFNPNTGLKRPFALFGLLFLLISFNSCKNYFIAHDFESKTEQHKTIAVLPVKMIFTGKQPDNLTEEQIRELEVAESKAFQIALHDEILASTRGGRKPIRISFQSYTETLKIIEESGHTIRESWDMDPKQLAQLLGVDAVVKMDVTKRRYISDLASFGISVGTDILNQLALGIPILYGGASLLGKTNDINTSAKVINMSDGTVLWSKAETQATDWRNPAETVIRYTCARIARDFPYRIPKK